MRHVMAGLLGVCLAGPAGAQGLGDVGRALGDELLQRVLPQQQPQPQFDPRREEYLRREREREAYEQGRRDAEVERRREDWRRPEGERGQPTARGGRDYDEDRRRDDARRPYYEPDSRREGAGRDFDDDRRPRREWER